MSKKFTVIWRRSLVEVEIAELVVSLMEKGKALDAVTKAMSTIDQLLSGSPELRGESRGDLERVLIVPPLTVIYEIHDDENIVYILSAYYRALDETADE